MIGLIQEIVVEKHPRGETTLAPLSVNIASAYIQSVSPYTLISKFIHETYPHWDQIKDKNTEFFVRNMLSLVPSNYHSYLSGLPELFLSMDDYEKKDMWIFIDSLVKISISYVHEQRDPTLVDGAKRYKTKAYTGREFIVNNKAGESVTVREHNIPLNRWAKSFDVILSWH
jgi:hypothetical protein